MKFIALGTLFVSLLFYGLPLAHAQEVTPEPTLTVEGNYSTETIDQSLADELAGLRMKEEESSGIITKFIIRLRIRQLENQLNIQKALE